RLGVRAARVARVREAHGRDVHRGAAVHDVPDAGLARVDVPVVQARDDPLLGEEHALQQQRGRLELGDPAWLADHERHEVLGHRVRVEVVAALRVHLDERARHEGVVRDVPVTLVVGRDRTRVLPVRVPGPHDPGDAPAVALLDLLGGPALGGAPQRVPHRRSGDRGHRSVVQPGHGPLPVDLSRRSRARCDPRGPRFGAGAVACAAAPAAAARCSSRCRGERPSRYFVISSQPASSSLASWSASISWARNFWYAGVATVSFHCAYASTNRYGADVRYCPDERIVDQPFSSPREEAMASCADVVAGMSASASLSAARLSVSVKKSMNSAASSTCSESMFTESVCGLAACSAPSGPSSGGSTTQSKPSGASFAMFAAWYEPWIVMATWPA